ncbi:MAG TPA: hypothetical protein VN088_14400 [Nocardioides sp.]|nr:hypothetical protein [Nocardioides sp.]
MSAVLGSSPDLPAPTPRAPRWRRRIVVGTAGVLLVGGLSAAGLGARWYLHTGAQPAEALPASTLAYLAVDLDPSGKEKLAAKGVLDKLPIAASDDLGGVADLRKVVVDKLLASGDCTGKTFDHDVLPWLGERAAVAMVTVESKPQPVIVLQSSDDGRADRGMAALSACGGSDFGHWDVRDGWIVWAEKQSYADAVVAGAKSGTLADDATYKSMVDEAGGTGLVTGYLAKSAFGTLFSTFIGDETSLPAGLVSEVAKKFPGMALSVRAEDDQVRADYVMTIPADAPARTGSVEPALADLPAGSSAVVALHPGQGMGGSSFKSAFDAGFDNSAATPRERRMIRRYSQRTLGAPIETVFSDLFDSTLVAVLGPTTAGDFGRSPVQLPIAGELLPATDKRDRVFGYFRKLAPQMGLDRWATESGDAIVAATSPANRGVLSGGGLTSSPTFRSVIDTDGHDLASVIYVDLHSGLLSEALKRGLVGEPKVLENLQKISAIGVAGWVDGATSHVQVRIALD